MKFRNNQPIYLQIGDFICANIITEKWKEKDKIPSIREMAVNVEVNPNTVMRTYSYLQDKGIIFNKRGIGYFVADNALKTTRKMEKEDFIQNELPEIFKKMLILEISVNEFGQLYETYQKREVLQ